MPKRKNPPESKKSDETCVTEPLLYREPERDEDGDVIMDGDSPVRIQPKLINVTSCYLQGMDLNDINQTKSKSIIKFLSENIINLPVYIINGHGSIDPRIKIEMGNQDSGRETRAAKKKRLKRAEEIKRLDFVDQLQEQGMAIYREDKTKYGKNFFEMPDGAFVAMHTPVGNDACMGSDTIKKLVQHETKKKPYFQTYKKTMFSTNGLQGFSIVGTNDNSAKIFVPPRQYCFNKNYSFCENLGDEAKEKFGILKFTNDMPDEEINTNIAELGSLPNPIMIPTNKADALEAKTNVIYTTTVMRDEILESIESDTDISLETIIRTLGPGIYIDYSCSGLVLRIFKNDGTQEVLDPDMNTAEEKQKGVRNQIIYSSLHRSFEYLEYMNRLLMNNVTYMTDSFLEGKKYFGKVIDPRDLLGTRAQNDEDNLYSSKTQDGLVGFDIENWNNTRLSSTSPGKQESFNAETIDTISLPGKGGKKTKKKRRKKKRKKRKQTKKQKRRKQTKKRKKTRKKGTRNRKK